MNSLYALMAKVEPEKHSNGIDIWYEASCPLCSRTEKATVLASDTIAAGAVRAKIRTHILFTHSKDLDPKHRIPGDDL